jgi:ribosomal protection tetracycline resistance protein
MKIGAVLVVSAVEGVQAQTRVLMRTLERLGIPTLIFMNKIDRGGADTGQTLAAIAEKLTPAIIAMGSARDLGTAAASCIPHGPADGEFTSRLTEALAEHDDELLAAYLGEASFSYGRLRRALAAQSRRGLVHPVFCGSAITGAGADALLDGIVRLLPAARGDDGPASGAVFKVERGTAGEKIAYVRMFSGTLRVRDRLCFGADRAGRVTAIAVFERGAAARRDAVTAGQIGRLWGLAEVRIGDVIGAVGVIGAAGVAGRGRAGAGSFPPPTLETVVVPCRRSDLGALYAALGQLAEQDPLIRVRQDDVRQEISVSLYGEVQKEVIQATLAGDFGLEVGFRETTTICIERPVGRGAAVEVIDQPPNPFLAGIGLRVDPAEVGAGVTFRLEIELGALPLAFLKAIEETVHLTLHQGLYGWQVTDAVVTLTHSGYWPRQSHSHATFDKSMSSTAGDFRNLTPLVLMAALRQAGTQVLEPVHHFRLEVPADTVGAVLPVLVQLRAVPRGQAAAGRASVLEGDIPAARTHELQQLLPALARGEGVLESAFDHYQPVRGPYPARTRWDDNPLNRQEYLLRVARPGTGRPR